MRKSCDTTTMIESGSRGVIREMSMSTVIAKNVEISVTGIGISDESEDTEIC